ncbi:hypothetical protein [Mesoaciditoga lauensis]|uniref:hypothetical protein n=1 Tax=Mesoaciditoga lauensis TaxID=1495039 RepID=UPI000568411D|nr:hypothetical protein [Mesoaciditoga lauensis]
MKKKFVMLIMMFSLLGVTLMATPSLSGNAGYIFRYSNGKIMQALRDVNVSTVELGNGFSARIRFTLLESRSLSEFFANSCDTPAFLQSNMANLTFNEAYLAYNNSSLELKAGRFYVSWGTSPLENAINMIEPYNFADIFDSPIQDSIIGLQNTIWFDDGSALETDIVPVFSPNVYPSLPSTVEFLQPTLKNIQIGVRYSTMMGDYNVYLDAYHGFDHAFVLKNGIASYPSLNAIGAEFSGPFPLNSDYNFYGEGALTLGKKYFGLIGVNGFLFNTLVGVEFTRGLAGESLSKIENAVFLYANKEMENMTLKSACAFSMNDDMKKGMFISASLNYQPMQNVSIDGGINYMFGDPEEYFGSQSNESGIYVKGEVYF